MLQWSTFIPPSNPPAPYSGPCPMPADAPVGSTCSTVPTNTLTPAQRNILTSQMQFMMFDAGGANVATAGAGTVQPGTQVTTSQPGAAGGAIQPTSLPMPGLPGASAAGLSPGVKKAALWIGGIALGIYALKKLI